MQAMFARRQLEHGDCLSQRTFLERQTTQPEIGSQHTRGSEEVGMKEELRKGLRSSFGVHAEVSLDVFNM